MRHTLEVPLGERPEVLELLEPLEQVVDLRVLAQVLMTISRAVEPVKEA